MDWYEFDAKKGQTLWIEAISNQLGLSSDPFLAIYRVKKDEKGQEQQSEERKIRKQNFESYFAVAFVADLALIVLLVSER